uniref:F-box domain-containing protein n=1 Tax=Oryza glumipatula TaxID=40148 RepID=A0A0D9Z004_9ORYZ
MVHRSGVVPEAQSSALHARVIVDESSMEEEEAASACEIARLPEELLVAALSLTSPRDACRAAAVCRDFRAAADSDAVWSRFLPRDLPRLADGELSPPPPSTKGLFLRLSAAPLLLPHELTSMWLEREKGGKFKEGAELLSVCWLEIHGKILSKMLSRNTNYAAYLVYRIADRSYGLDFPFQEASVSIGGSTTTRQVGSVERRLKRRCSHALVLAEDIEHPQKRSDGWMELKLGELYNEEGDDGEVCISFRETEGHWKRGLVVQGIEIRPKKTLTSNSLACSHEKPSYSLLTTSRSSKEEIFLADGLRSMWLDMETGFKCYMLSARALQLANSTDTWRLISLTGASRFSEVIELPACYELVICGKIPCKMLSGNTNYAAYIVFVVVEDSFGLATILDASVSVGGSQCTTHQVCFDSTSSLSADEHFVEDNIEVPQDGSVILPQERDDGWMELEVGEFFHSEDCNGDVCFSLLEAEDGRWLSKRGLVVQGIEIRPKKSSCRIVFEREREMEMERGRRTMEEAWIDRLPQDLLQRVIPLETPRDACRAAAVSPAFRAVADSDVVWGKFQPDDSSLQLADGELFPPPRSKKERFLRLSAGLLLLPDRRRGMWLDRGTGARFEEGAQLIDVCWMEIRCNIDSKMLSPNSTYAAFMVFKIAEGFYGLDTPLQEGTVSLGGRESRREVAFTSIDPRPPQGSAAYPQKRADGWMEVELGEFFNENGEDGEVGISLMSKGPNWKRGLIAERTWQMSFLRSTTVLDDGLRAFYDQRERLGRRINCGYKKPDSSKGAEASPSMEEGEACDDCECEIARLPEELLSAAISLTAPRDAFRAAAVSRAFRAAADSDAVWASFLPRDLPDLADGELSPAPPSKKDLFLRLSAGHYHLLPDRLKGMWLDRETGAKCYVLSARALVIIWTCTPRYWRWIPLTDSRFTEAAELLSVCWLEILGNIDSRMLSPNSTYAAVLVFKIAEEFYQLDTVDATVNLGGSKSSREVALTRSRRRPEEEISAVLFPRTRADGWMERIEPRAVVLAEDIENPQKRADGWMELKLGELYNEEGDDGEVCISFMETKGGHWKSGLVVQVFYSTTAHSHTLSDDIFLLCFFFSFAIKPDSRTEGSMEEEGEGLCEIARLPEELLSAAISRASPRDACHAAAVSPAFRAAADSDAVWASFLPRDLPDLADGELSPAPASKKELFLRLSDGPYLLSDRLMSMWLDRETGAKCYMLSARSLVIIWGDTPHYWRWIPLTDSRFAEGAELIDVCWLEIRGRIHSKMLSPNSTYAAYMVFKIADEFYGLDAPFQEASVSLGGRGSTKIVCVQSYDSEDEEVPENYWPMSIGPLLRRRARRRDRRLVLDEGVTVPQKRTDEWMELEMGEFINEEGEDGEVCFSLMETKGGNWKRGLIVQGIEIRLKKSG